MHVFPLQYRQLPGVYCVCRYHGGSPASSDSHELNIELNLCNNYYSSLDLASNPAAEESAAWIQLFA